VSVGLAHTATATLGADLAARASRLERGADGLLGSAVLELAVLEAAARSARAALFAHLDALWDAVVAGEADLEATSIEVQLVSRHAVAQAADVATRAHRLGGAAALHEEHPLQRAARDAQAVAQHGLFGLVPHEALGRMLVSRRMAPRDALDA
jgi:alkylation response protein AidB-like acyl-CoA dehydrogenase